jgi:hypothetical protein
VDKLLNVSITPCPSGKMVKFIPFEGENNFSLIVIRIKNRSDNYVLCRNLRHFFTFSFTFFIPANIFVKTRGGSESDVIEYEVVIWFRERFI